MRTGVRIGIDVGKSRVGVARSDPHGMMAVPVQTFPRNGALPGLVELAVEHEAIEFVCGLPLNMSGAETESTKDARDFANELNEKTGVPVRLVDERLTTVAAQSSLHGAHHTTKSSRAVIDQVAAMIVLEVALNAERAGNTLGEMVGES